MTPHIADDQNALLDYLYEEGDPAERLRIARHLQDCATCSVAVLELQSVRGMLADWTPPPVKLGFRIVQDDIDGAAVRPRAPWWKPAAGRMPVWAQAAAAVVLFAAGMAVSQLDVRYGDGAFTVRSRSAAPVAEASVMGPMAPVSARSNNIALAPESSSNPNFRAIEQQLRADLGGRADANDILRRVKALIDQSEERQQRQLALRLADVVRDFDTQRRADLIQVQQNFGQLEGQTGEAVAHNRELLNYLVRTSGTK